MKRLQELLTKLDACDTATEWAQEKTIETIVAEVHRGDWLLWLAKKIDLPIPLITLAKGKCAETVIHLMKDQRSKDAVKAAIAFGNGEISREELNACAAAAYAADAYAAAAYAADAYAAAAAAAAAAAYAADAYAAAAAAAAADAAADAYADADARKENQLKTANICREVLGAEIIKKVNELLNN